MSLSFYSAPPWPPNEEARQEAASRAIARTGQVDGQLQRIVEAAARHFAVPIAALSIIDHDRQWFAASVGLEGSESPRATSFCAHAMLMPDILVVADATGDARFAGNPLVLFDPNIRFYAGAPVANAAGLAVGTLCVVDQTTRNGSGSYADLRLFADQAARLLFS